MEEVTIMLVNDIKFVDIHLKALVGRCYTQTGHLPFNVFKQSSGFEHGIDGMPGNTKEDLVMTVIND